MTVANAAEDKIHETPLNLCSFVDKYAGQTALCKRLPTSTAGKIAKSTQWWVHEMPSSQDTSIHDQNVPSV